MLKSLIWVGLGGGLGSVLRYLASIYIDKVNGFPLATFIVNIVGSFIIGVLLARYGQSNPNGLALFFMVGFCGGFTTFSSFSAETLTLIQNGQVGIAFIYIISSVMVGLMAVWTGYIFMK